MKSLLEIILESYLLRIHQAQQISPNKNYLLVPRKGLLTIILQKYKTSKRYGKVVVPLSNELSQLSLSPFCYKIYIRNKFLKKSPPPFLRRFFWKIFSAVVFIFGRFFFTIFGFFSLCAWYFFLKFIHSFINKRSFKQ